MAASTHHGKPVPALSADAWAAEWAAREPWTADQDGDVLERKTNAVLLAGLAALAVVLGMALIGPALVSFGPNETDASRTLTPPSREHLMGTDQYGRDVLSRVVHAARLDLGIAVSITLIALTFGTVIGGIIGFYGGVFENVVMRAVDVLLAFPGFVLALGITAMLGNSTRNVIIAVAIAYLPYYIRIVRSEMLTLREMEYASAAKVVGVSRVRILLYHLLPNALPLALAQATLTLGWGILDAAGLSFLGVGIRPPTAEWGVLVGEGSQYINSGQWWISVFPGLAILIAVLGFNLVGDWVRDRFGPR